MSFKKLHLPLLIVTTLLVFSTPLRANELTLVKAAVTQFLPDTKITSLKKTPVDGLYEIITDDNLFYVDKTGRYGFIGSLYDLKDHENLTPVATQDTQAQPTEPSLSWDQLPHDLAIIENKGAKYKLAVFADINCPYCRRLGDILHKLPDVETHTFLISLWQRSIEPTKAILCAEDKVNALHAAFQNKPVEQKTCDSDALKRLNALAARHHIQGTPFLVRGDGMTSTGARSKAFLLDWLKESAQ